MERRKSVVAMLLLCVAVFACAGSMAQRQASKPHPLIIEEQGSFAVGGSVIIAPGTFDPIRQGAFNPAGADPAGQTRCHGDHAYVFYQVPVDARKLPLVV
jgi:hypothetical protein